MPRVRTNTNQTIPAEAATMALSFTRPLGYDPTLDQPAAAPDPSELFGATSTSPNAMDTVRIPYRTVDPVTETIRNYPPLSIADIDRIIVHRNSPFVQPEVQAAPGSPYAHGTLPPFPPDIPRVAGRPAIGHRDGMGRGGPSDPNMILTRSRAIHPSSFYSLIPTEAQAHQLADIAVAADRFASVIDATLEVSMEKDRILRNVREIVFWTRESVLRYVDGTPREMCSPNIPDRDEANTGAAGATVRPEPTMDYIDPRARFSDIANGHD